MKDVNYIINNTSHYEAKYKSKCNCSKKRKNDGSIIKNCSCID